jgi:hypothetical protein
MLLSFILNYSTLHCFKLLYPKLFMVIIGYFTLNYYKLFHFKWL